MELTENQKIKTKNYIYIKGARVHNLKNIDVEIERNKLTIITGLSGSGKSSLAFDTLFAEGQRRYVESLSAYARQFLGKIEKPDVDHIVGISPAIAIEQKVNTVNKRSTVGTSTEIYDYLKLLFARIGKTYSPISGNPVKREQVNDVFTWIIQLKPQSKVYILSSIQNSDKTAKEQLEFLLKQGYSRIWYNNKIEKIETFNLTLLDKNNIEVLIDRFVIDSENSELNSRIFDSIETAFYEGKGSCKVIVDSIEEYQTRTFNNKFELDGMNFIEPDTNFFSFNNPVGACKNCEGYGSVIGIDDKLVIPNPALSVFEDAIVCWKGDKMKYFKEQLILNAFEFNFPIHKPIELLTEEQYKLLWSGNKYFDGIDKFFKMLEGESYKIQYRVMLSRYRGKKVCTDCKGTRLRKDAGYVKINTKSITDLVLMPISDLSLFFDELKLTKNELAIANRLLIEIRSRLKFLTHVGLGYLTLNRLSSTLSGGESQRINLATSLGSSLVGSMYILDEPSIGLHSKDTELLIEVLNNLKKIGNTVIIVEHDEEIIRAADNIIDLGPYAGHLGGELVFQGKINELLKNKKSLTAKYLNGDEKIPLPNQRRKWSKFIEISNANENNLKNLTVCFPLQVLSVVTGVSGSGKSTLVKNCLLPALKRKFDGYHDLSSNPTNLSGDLSRLKGVEFVNQNPIGKSSRSNPATYIKAYDDIRNLFCAQKLAKSRGLKPSHFSFNIDGGRCETCKGEGEITVEMQFMSDVHLKCEECNGKRFKEEILEIKINDKSISDILDLTIDEAIDFFNCIHDNYSEKIIQKLKTLQEVGLGYVHLGQSSSSLSGGEAQRVKLASFIGKRDESDNLLFIFDEPTTGLHFHDVKKLLTAFDALIQKGHSLLVIEHNLDVIKSADWIIDIGPEGGKNGGNIVFEGTPEEIIRSESSFTGKYLKNKLISTTHSKIE
ncbi:MAG: excinuclease ABC subunit UvrA [Flavobacteriales bacterium]|nr:excinuclease ABC subunit UvrA [Flavobacteriales bacterium]